MVIVACTTARGVVFQVVSETHDLQLGRRAFFTGFADDVLFESPDGRFRFRPTAQTHRMMVTVDGETLTARWSSKALPSAPQQANLVCNTDTGEVQEWHP